MAYQAGEFDVIVVGAGHAGIEASLAAARMGSKTVMLTMNPDMVGFMYCNPSIGGPAKGIVVREIDALGGEMARAIDATYIQMKMLNTSKGPAVRALRAQADKFEYQNRMKKALEDEPNLLLRQALVERLLIDEEGRCVGVVIQGRSTGRKRSSSRQELSCVGKSLSVNCRTRVVRTIRCHRSIYRNILKNLDLSSHVSRQVHHRESTGKRSITRRRRSNQVTK